MRESGEPIPAHLWVMVKITTLEAVYTPRRTTRKGTSLSDPPPSPYSPMCVRTDENDADFFTKVLPARKFFPLRDKIMNVPPHLRRNAASASPSRDS